MPLNTFSSSFKLQKKDLIEATNLYELNKVMFSRSVANIGAFGAICALAFGYLAGSKKLAEWRGRKMTKTEATLLTLISLASYVGCQYLSTGKN